MDGRDGEKRTDELDGCSSSFPPRWSLANPLPPSRYVAHASQERRVATYWAVDPVNRLVEVWTPDAIFPVTEQATTLTWRHPAIDSPCLIDLARVFALA
jgi:hypothetical protein